MEQQRRRALATPQQKQHKSLRNIAMTTLAGLSIIGSAILHNHHNKPNTNTKNPVPITQTYNLKGTFPTTTKRDDLATNYDAYTAQANHIIHMIQTQVHNYYTRGITEKTKKPISEAQLLEEITTQLYHESRLTQTNLDGTIVEAPCTNKKLSKKQHDHAKGVGQNQQVAGKRVNKLINNPQLQQYFTGKDSIDLKLMAAPTKAGANENIKASTIYNIIAYALTEDTDLANARYYDGGDDFPNKKSAGAKKYIKAIDKIQDIYENPEQFKQYVHAQRATQLLHEQREKANNTNNKRKKIRAYEHMIEFYDHLKQKGATNDKHKDLWTEARIELANLHLQKNNYEKALEYLQPLEHKQPKNAHERRLKKDLEYITRIAQSRLAKL
jgi:hypothetical protein